MIWWVCDIAIQITYTNGNVVKTDKNLQINGGIQASSTLAGK